MSIVAQEAPATSKRHADALRRVREACQELESTGITARVVGSLATGKFALGSDVDILVIRCPRHLKYAIEGKVEDCLGELPFDVLYLDEIPAIKRERILKESVDARDLR